MDSMDSMWIGIALFFGLLVAVITVGAIGVAILTSVMAQTFQSGAAQAGHWSPREVRIDVPLAPYRGAALSTSESRGAPAWLRVAGATGVGMGALTTCLLAPTALLLGAGYFEGDVIGIGALLANASGFPAGMVLVSSARKAVRGQRTTLTGFLLVHFIASATLVGGACMQSGMMTGVELALGYGSLGLLLTAVFARAHRLPGAGDPSKGSALHAKTPPPAKEMAFPDRS